MLWIAGEDFKTKIVNVHFCASHTHIELGINHIWGKIHVTDLHALILCLMMPKQRDTKNTIWILILFAEFNKKWFIISAEAFFM